MDREQARQEIRRQIDCKRYLRKARNGGYCCPFCNSGTGENGTGAVKPYHEEGVFTWYCHACQKHGDAIDLYMEQEGVDYNEALTQLAQEIGITKDPYRLGAGEFSGNAPRGRRTQPNGDLNQQSKKTTQEAAERPQEGAEPPAEATADYTAYYHACRVRITEPAAVEYLKSRGISTETAAAYWVGFDPAADPAGAPGAMENEYKPHPCPRIIVPATNSFYIGRRIDGREDFRVSNPTKEKGAGGPAIFNAGALYAQDVQEIFVTEGAFDALSILEAGYTAIALNSTSNYKILLETLKNKGTNAILILSLDNDDAGRKATGELREGLRQLNVSHIVANVSGKYKDPNEALVKDKKAFLTALEEVQQKTAPKPDNTQYYINTLMAGEIDRFKHDKKTGFADLDQQAGGLYSGLYVLAAISSLGKTTFALQLADQLAERGEDVIYFSMEQSRLELVSKSLARRTAQKDMTKAVPSLAIRKGYLPQHVLQEAKEYKAAIGDRMSIVEGNFSCDIGFIGNYVREYVRRNGARPVVFIDYLQILQPSEMMRKKGTKKDAVDEIVTELKRLSRELDLTMFVVSSVNRANYLTPIDFESLKESGGIEYSCDVLWGLQLQCLNSPEFEKAAGKVKEQREIVKKAKAETPRKVELCCLKNRYGIASYSCYFDYYPANDLFQEQAAGSSLKSWDKVKRV